MDTIKDTETYALLVQAVKRYAVLVKERGTEKDYMKHFSTFMNCWRDYIGDSIEETKEERQEKIIAELNKLDEEAQKNASSNF